MKSRILSEFASQFLLWVEETHSLEPKSRKYYQNGWKLLKSTKLANFRLSAISNHHCETVSFPGSSANANTALRTLRRMLAKAKEMGLLADVPKIALRKEWGRSVGMTVNDATAIAQRMPEGDAKDALLVLRGTGMRPSEAFAMRWEFFNWNEMYYQNPRGKRPSARRAVPLLGESLEILSRRRMVQGLPAEGWVFPASSNFGHITTIHKAYTRARKAAGLPSAMCLYTARHGALSDLANVVSLKTVMEVGGHTDSKTAMRYQHPATADLRARLEAARVQ